MLKKSLLSISLCCILAACSPFADGDGTDVPVIETLNMVPVNASEIDGLNNTEMQGFATAIQKSCDKILTLPSDKEYGPSILGGKAADWHQVCRASDGQYDQTWLMENFDAYAVYGDGDRQGLFTGYYEPLLFGARTKSDIYSVPLYKMPADLIEVDLGLFSDDLKGKKVSGRAQDGKLLPYFDRSEIDAGALEGRDLELVWVDDAVDAFFLQIQGSGQVEMQNGEVMRVGYAGQNGRSYYAIGRDLIDRGILTKENVSLQTIRAWLDENPDQANDVLHLNPSYIFFNELKGDGPLGAQGVALTPEVSLAVDRRLYPYGMPVLLQADMPLSDQKINRMMVAQDTGGAIRGAVRGDVFWGAGDDAALKAGHMKSDGKFWVFLPKTIKLPAEMQKEPGFWFQLFKKFG